METRDRTILVIALVLLAALFLFFGSALLTGTMMYGGYGGMMGWGMMGGMGWMWLPTLLVLALGVLLGWAIFGKK